MFYLSCKVFGHQSRSRSQRKLKQWRHEADNCRSDNRPPRHDVIDGTKNWFRHRQHSPLLQTWRRSYSSHSNRCVPQTIRTGDTLNKTGLKPVSRTVLEEDGNFVSGGWMNRWVETEPGLRDCYAQSKNTAEIWIPNMFAIQKVQV